MTTRAMREDFWRKNDETELDCSNPGSDNSWNRSRTEPDRCRSYLPLSHLLEVVQRVQRLSSGRSDQLPVGRFRCRYSPGFVQDSRLWRLRRADDRPATGGLED